jgi:hypothetical protein
MHISDAGLRLSAIDLAHGHHPPARPLLCPAAGHPGHRARANAEGVEPACYRDGYAARAKSTNTSSALTGGLLGTAVLVILVVSATSGSGY